DESHRKTRHPRRRAARRAATALGRATTLAEQPRCSLDGRRAAAAPPTALSSTSHTGKPATLDVERPGARLRRSAAPPPSPSSPGVPSTGAERLQRHQRPSRRRVTPENPPPSTSSGPARGYGARPRHHPRRAAPVFPRRAPSGCSATNGPLVDESHRKTRHPRRRAARRAATALGRATTLAEQPRCSLDGRRAAAAPPTALSSTSHTGKPATLDVERPGARLRRSAAPPPSPSSPGVPSTGAERLQRHQRPSRRRVTPENPPPSTSSGPARGYGARPRHHPRRAARGYRDGRPAAAAPPTALSSTSHTGKPATLDVGRPGARLRRSAAPPPSPSGPVFPRRAPSGCSATNGPLVDESHRKTRHPRRRAARRAATALGRATT